MDLPLSGCRDREKGFHMGGAELAGTWLETFDNAA